MVGLNLQVQAECDIGCIYGQSSNWKQDIFEEYRRKILELDQYTTTWIGKALEVNMQRFYSWNFYSIWTGYFSWYS
jgi:hypothetical protein